MELTLGEILRQKNRISSPNQHLYVQLRGEASNYYNIYVKSMMVRKKKIIDIALKTKLIEQIHWQKFPTIDLKCFYFIFYAELCNLLIFDGYFPKNFVPEQYEFSVSSHIICDTMKLEKDTANMITHITDAYFETYIEPQILKTKLKLEHKYKKNSKVNIYTRYKSFEIKLPPMQPEMVHTSQRFKELPASFREMFLIKVFLIILSNGLFIDNLSEVFLNTKTVEIFHINIDNKIDPLHSIGIEYSLNYDGKIPDNFMYIPKKKKQEPTRIF